MELEANDFLLKASESFNVRSHRFVEDGDDDDDGGNDRRDVVRT